MNACDSKKCRSALEAIRGAGHPRRSRSLRWVALSVLCAAAILSTACATHRYSRMTGETALRAESTSPSATSSSSKTSDAPEISRSVGQEGGVIVFWPRIIPRAARDDSREIAMTVQTRLRGIVERALPGRPIDMRPEPERVCPMAGCKAMTVGVLFLREQDGCAILALVAGPGKASTEIIPWAGRVRLRSATVPFREPPESEVTVLDFAPCGSVLGELSAQEDQVVAAIRAHAQ